MSGTGDVFMIYGIDVGDSDDPVETQAIYIPDVWYVQLDLLAATSITASFSVLPYGD